MPKLKKSTLSGLVDSDSDDSQFMSAMPTPDSAAENKVPGKKGRGKPKTAPSKITKASSKAPARRASGRLVAKASENTAPAKVKRQALKDKTNQQYASETEEVDDFDQSEDVLMEGTYLDESVVAVPKSRPSATKKATNSRTKAVKEVSRTNYNISEDIPEVPSQEERVVKKKVPARKGIPQELSPEKVIQESQVPEWDGGEDVDEEIEEPISRPAHKVSRTQSHSRPRQPSVQRRRAGSASDTERSDPALRRKLGEMTKKYETLNIKYQDLREIGLKEAERNFERLRKQSEEKKKSNSIACMHRILLIIASF